MYISYKTGELITSMLFKILLHLVFIRSKCMIDYDFTFCPTNAMPLGLGRKNHLHCMLHFMWPNSPTPLTHRYLGNTSVPLLRPIPPIINPISKNPSKIKEGQCSTPAKCKQAEHYAISEKDP